MNKYKITATFKRGKIWSDPLFFSLLLTAVGFFVLYVWSFFYEKGYPQTRFFIAFFGLLLVGGFAVALILASRNRAYAKKCLKDSVEKTAFIELFDKDTNLGRAYRDVKLCASFRHENKKIKRISIYDTAFRDFADREITFLYSPTYDEILLLK